MAAEPPFFVIDCPMPRPRRPHHIDWQTVVALLVVIVWLAAALLLAFGVVDAHFDGRSTLR